LARLQLNVFRASQGAHENNTTKG